MLFRAAKGTFASAEADPTLSGLHPLVDGLELHPAVLRVISRVPGIKGTLPADPINAELVGVQRVECVDQLLLDQLIADVMILKPKKKKKETQTHWFVTEYHFFSIHFPVLPKIAKSVV